MNQSYRLIWSAIRSAWIVVSELVKSHTKSTALMVVTATAANPAQAFLVDNTMYLNSTDGMGSVRASSGVGDDRLVEFTEGQTFTFSSERFLLNSIGFGSKISEQGAGGG
ncbi:MAG: ESPR domain-containing protein, partial [Neisseriaceae bacterium]|nr:ESPR domain-containing protein [Neisseriaceae bacterium]